ncbi:MAG: ABC transporter substrate-binding protein, partial [Gemmatimonadota bacterium]
MATLATLAVLAVLAGPTTAAVRAQEPIPIGLVIPGPGPHAAIGAALREGAELAVRRANEAGGFRGRPFVLRVVTDDGLWGQGLSRVTGLAFTDPVVAVVGGADGRGGHLIQQVITKARLPFVTPWASDFTLS